MIHPSDSFGDLPEIRAEPKAKQSFFKAFFNSERHLTIVNEVGQRFNFQGVRIKNPKKPPPGHVTIMAKRDDGKMIAVAVPAAQISEFLESDTADGRVDCSELVRAKAKSLAEVDIAEKVEEIRSHTRGLNQADIEKTLRVAYRFLAQKRTVHSKKHADQPYSISICELPGRKFEAVIHLPKQKLGEGGFKKVKKVYAVTRGCFEARGGLLDPKDKDNRKFLEEEKEILCRLNGSRGIIGMHMAYDPKNPSGVKKPGLVMECCDGDLCDAVDGDLTRADLVGVLDDAAEGIRESHKREIVNSDVKLDNILVKRDSEGKLNGFLSDFGCAIDLTTVDATGIDELLLQGTESYLPPETYHRGKKLQDDLKKIQREHPGLTDTEALQELYKARDVFSFGVTILRAMDEKFDGNLELIFAEQGELQHFPRYKTDAKMQEALEYDPANKDPLYQLAWTMIRVDFCKRPSAEEVARELARIRALPDFGIDAPKRG